MASFRICEKEDEQTWIALNREFMDYEIRDEELWGETNRATDTRFAKTFREAMEEPEMVTLIIIEENGEALGLINLVTIYSIWAHGKAMIIDDLYIRDKYQGEGMGKAAMDFVEKFAKERNCTRLQFMSEKSNPRARAFYQNLGYIPTEMNFYVKHLKELDKE